MTFQAFDRTQSYSLKYDFRQVKFGDASVLPLWVADMDFAAPPCVQRAIAKRAAHPIYGYTIYPKRYFEAIIRWYAKRYEVKITSDTIVPAHGVVPSLYDAVRAFSGKGDGIIVMPPIYPPFFEAIKRQGRRIVSVPLRYKNGRYGIDFEVLEQQAKSASMMLLCSPHNPVGRVWQRNELERLGAIAKRYDLIVVSDEIHGDIVYKPFVSALAIEEWQARLIVLNAPSKSFNIAGLHTSYAIIPNPSLRRRFQVSSKRVGQSDDANLFGVEALIAAYEDGEAWLNKLIVTLRNHIDYVRDTLRRDRLPIRPSETEATYLMWLDCRAMGLADDALRDFFVRKAGLGLNDGVSFGQGGDGFMRLNIATDRATLHEAMQRLRKALG